MSVPSSHFYLLVNGTVDSCTYPYIDNVYIRYTVINGADWQLIDGIQYGISQICRQQSIISKLLNGINSSGSTMNINYPIELTYKSSNVYGWPQIVISVYTLNKFGATDSICGYTSLHIPTQPGTHTRTCTLYKPVDSTAYQKYVSMITNKKPEFYDPVFIAQSRGRELTRVQSVGTITVTLNVLTRYATELGYSVNSERLNSLYKNDKYIQQQNLTDEQIAALQQRKAVLYSKPADLHNGSTVLHNTHITTQQQQLQQQQHNNATTQPVHPISTQSAAQQQQLQSTQVPAVQQQPPTVQSPTYNGLKSFFTSFGQRAQQPIVQTQHVNLTADNASIHQNIPAPATNNDLTQQHQQPSQSTQPVQSQSIQSTPQMSQTQFPVVHANTDITTPQPTVQSTTQPVMQQQREQTAATESLIGRFRKPNINETSQEQITNEAPPIQTDTTQQRPTFDQTISLHKQQQQRNKPSLFK